RSRVPALATAASRATRVPSCSPTASGSSTARTRTAEKNGVRHHFPAAGSEDQRTMKMRTTLAAAAAFALTQAAAQPPRDTEKAADSPPAPRLADGTVDLGGNGIWNLWWVT